MRARPVSLALAPFLLSACVGGGPPTPPGLAYGVPAEASVVYLTEDRSDTDIDAGGQNMQARGSSEMTLDVTFGASPGGVEVTFRVRDLAASQSTPMGSQSASEADIEGPLVFTLDRTGEATVLQEPTVTGTAVQFFQPASLAHGFFPKLPGRAAQVGTSWTDTVSFEATPEGGEVKVSSVLEYAVAGDSVIDGRSLVKITFEGTVDQVATGQITGMDFSQNISGPVSGWVLWDLQRQLMVQSRSEGDLRGSMEVAAAPFPLGVRIRQQSRVWIQDGT